MKNKCLFYYAEYKVNCFEAMSFGALSVGVKAQRLKEHHQNSENIARESEFEIQVHKILLECNLLENKTVLRQKPIRTCFIYFLIVLFS